MKKNLFAIFIFLIFLSIILYLLNNQLQETNPTIKNFAANNKQADKKPPAEQGNNTKNIAASSTKEMKMILNPPSNFKLSVYARGLGKVRDIEINPGGGILASQLDEGRVVLLSDSSNDGAADQKNIILDGLTNPHGILLDCNNDENCRLYVAEENKVSYFEYDVKNRRVGTGTKILDLPKGEGHFTRSLLKIKDNKDDRLLVLVGSSCNVCHESNARRAKILSVNLDGSDEKVYASGLRNSVFMKINPATGEIWATENGRDWLGDDLPPDEINIIKEGQNYGWPICYGKNIHDSDFDKAKYIRNPCEDMAPSKIDIQAHSAVLGLDFFGEEGWPEEYRHNLLVAYHGSWNRTEPTGYKIVRFKLDEDGNYISHKDFLTGFLNKEKKIIGRPVDVLITPGIIFVSDDLSGKIYRIEFEQDIN